MGTEALVMLAVGGGYNPAAGKNTFRVASEKYEALRPGDHVEMHHKVGLDNQPYAVEFLTVAAVAHGDLPTMLYEHAKNNHGANHHSELREILDRCYKGLEDSTRMVVITFH